jgi:hypothetical protein
MWNSTFHFQFQYDVAQWVLRKIAVEVDSGDEKYDETQRRFLDRKSYNQIFSREYMIGSITEGDFNTWSRNAKTSNVEYNDIDSFSVNLGCNLTRNSIWSGNDNNWQKCILAQGRRLYQLKGWINNERLILQSHMTIRRSFDDARQK